MKFAKQILVLIGFVLISTLSIGQRDNQAINDQAAIGEYKLIPDKLIEIGAPLVAAILFLNIIVTLLKNRGDHQLKVKLIDAGVSEDALIKIFKESNSISRMQPLKWFLFSAALALSFLVIYLFRNRMKTSEGFLPLAVIFIFISLASLVYYRITTREK